MPTRKNNPDAPRLRILTDEKIEKIIQAALTCLERTGVEVQNRDAIHLLQSAGARVDGTRIRIPARIIENALEKAPGSFTLHGREDAFDIEVSPGGRTLFGPGPTCPYFMDPENGERRKARRGDPAATARVCDALEHMDYVMSLGLIDDVAPSLAAVHEFAEMMTNTRKPVLAWAFKLEELKAIHRIGRVVAGGEEALRRRPRFAFLSTWHAPLCHTDHDLRNSLWAVEKGIPLIYIGVETAGLTTPITGAGLLVTTLASMLSGMAVFQLEKPGAPVCLAVVPAPMDPRTARPLYGGPEMSLYSAAVSDVVQHLGIPFMGTAGASDAKIVDQQAAMESAIQIVLSNLSGAGMVHDIGFLDCAETGSLEMLVMNDVIIGMAKRIGRGIEVTDETLMLDRIDRVGPLGEFISSDETAARCREEIHIPPLMDRDPWTEWRSNGASSMLDRIKIRLKEILAHHAPPRYARDVHDEIEQILLAAEEREGSA